MDNNSLKFSSGSTIRRPRIYQKIYAVVKLIPHGQVATYGQIARLAGIEGHARLVGYALHCLPGKSNIPWHRVINRHGQISPSQFENDSGSLQQKLLEAEGINFNMEGLIQLNRYQWCE
jgi:methylated-DNA-protein-cysteine methyltransferase-like protein